MKGVTFGQYHSYATFGLILSSKEIAAPKVKTMSVDVPGADGVLDFTEYFGEPKYENRKLAFRFSTMVPQSQFLTLFSAIQNALHGQKMNITLDDDPEWYYTGRITVPEWKTSKRTGKLTVDCDCEPFKHKISSQTIALCGNNLLNLDSGKATAVGTWTKTETGYTFERGTGTGGSFVYFSVPVKKGQSYVFSADYGNAGTLYVYKDKLYGEQITKTNKGEPAVFTAEETGFYVFGLYVVSSTTEAEFSNVMLKAGSAVGAYEAYDGTEKEVVAIFGNTRKNAVPSAYMTGAMSMESDSVFDTLTEGKQLLDSFIFKQGDNSFTFKGNGVAVIEWEEGGL